MAGKEGLTPEEIQAFRVKLAGNTPAPLGKGLTEFDRKAADVSSTVSRLGENQYVKGILGGVGGSSPATPMLRDAVEQVDLQRNGGIGGLSTATQSALARPQAPEELRALDSSTPDVQAAPSLKDQLLSKLRGGAGGGGVSPLGGLRAAYLTSRRRQIGDFEQDKSLAGQMGNQQASHVMSASQLHDAYAARQERDAEIQREADEKAHSQHQQFLARNAELADDIGRQKIDPKRLFKSQGGADRALHVAGGFLGGLTRASNGGKNAFLDRFDKEVAQDIQSQMDEVDNKKASLGARQNVFAQMLAETGDRRLAAMQTRNLMYEATKQHIAAEDARLGVPELSTQAQQKIQSLQHQQDALQTQFDAEAYQTAQQQAAAAAASQRAAEKAAWDRQMQLAELGLKKDHLEVERAKAMGGSLEDLNKQAQHLGEKLAAPELAQGRAAVDASKLRLSKVGPDEGLPGVGRGADLREKLAGRPTGIAALFPQNHILNKVAGLSDEERVSRNDWEKVKLAYRKQITGSGGSAEEMKVIEAAFEGAKTPAEQRAAIENADSVFKQIESRHKAGVDPRALQLYEGRLQGQAGIQPRDEQLRKKLAGDR